jgi:hypothetical protein
MDQVHISAARTNTPNVRSISAVSYYHRHVLLMLMVAGGERLPWRNGIHNAQ